MNLFLCYQFSRGFGFYSSVTQRPFRPTIKHLCFPLALCLVSPERETAGSRASWSFPKLLAGSCLTSLVCQLLSGGGWLSRFGFGYLFTGKLDTLVAQLTGKNGRLRFSKDVLQLNSKTDGITCVGQAAGAGTVDREVGRAGQSCHQPGPDPTLLSTGRGFGVFYLSTSQSCLCPVAEGSRARARRPALGAQGTLASG